MSPKIFNCYRRKSSDYIPIVSTLNLPLLSERDAVIFDVGSAPLGVDFREFLSAQVGQCDALLAIVGDRWLRLLSDQAESPPDFVPILVQSAKMPFDEDLPAEIAGFAWRNAAEVRGRADLILHLKRLVSRLETLFEKRKAARRTAEARKTSIIGDPVLRAAPHDLIIDRNPQDVDRLGLLRQRLRPSYRRRRVEESKAALGAVGMDSSAILAALAIDGLLASGFFDRDIGETEAPSKELSLSDQAEPIDALDGPKAHMSGAQASAPLLRSSGEEVCSGFHAFTNGSYTSPIQKITIARRL